MWQWNLSFLNQLEVLFEDSLRLTSLTVGFECLLSTLGVFAPPWSVLRPLFRVSGCGFRCYSDDPHSRRRILDSTDVLLLGVTQPRLVFLPASILVVHVLVPAGRLFSVPAPRVRLTPFPPRLLRDCLEHEGPDCPRGLRNAERLAAGVSIS